MQVESNERAKLEKAKCILYGVYKDTPIDELMYFDIEKFNHIKNNKISEEWLYRKLFKAERKARKGKLQTRDVYLFEMNLEVNLRQLAHDIWTGVYYPRRGIAFIIEKPVIREIFAAQFRDRIVHHFLFDMVYEWWDKHLINNSYSCRVGKGSLYGMKMLRRHMRRESCNFTEETYIMKLDIQGYFMSLNRRLLFERVVWGLNQQFAHAPAIRMLLRYIWARVIFDNPCDGVSIRGKRSDWRLLPKTKTLFGQPEGYGIVIGNLSSQLLSNIFLDLLDRYIIYVLGYHNYGRYVDDFYIVAKASRKKELLRDVKKIEKYLKTELELTLHPNKRYCQEVHKGVEFLGFVVYPYYVVVSKRFKNNFTRAAAEVGMGYREVESITSYLGRLKHVNGKKLAKKVFAQMGWWYNY